MPDNSIQPLQPIPTLQNQQGSLSPAAIEALRKFATGLYGDKYKPPNARYPFYTWANGLSDAGGDILGAMTYNRANELERQQGVRSGRAALGLPDDDSAVQPAPFGGALGPLGKPLQNLFGGGDKTASADKPPTPQAPTSTGSAFTENGTIDPVHARVVAQLESGGDPSAVKGSYRGTYQFKNGQYGITDKNWQDPGAQAAAFALEQKDLKTMLEARGIDPTPQNLYMAHLHGAGGLISHTQNPDQPAWLSMAQTKEGRDHGKQAEAWARETVTGNPYAPNMDPNVSSGDYLKGWGDKYNRTYARFSPDANVRTGVIPPGGAPRPPSPVPAVASSTPAVRPPGVPPTLPPGGTTPPRIPYTDPKDLAANRGDTAEQPNLFMDLSKLPIPRPRPTSGAPLQYAGAAQAYEKPSFRNDLGLPPPEPAPPAPGTPTDQINKRFGPWQTDPRTGTTTPSPSMDDFNLDAKGNVRTVPLPQPRPNIPVPPQGAGGGRLPFAPEGPTGNVQTAQAVPPPGPQNGSVGPTGAGQGTIKQEPNWFQQQASEPGKPFIDTSKLPGRPRYDWNAIANNWLRYSPQQQEQFVQLHNAEQQPLRFELPGGGQVLYSPENPGAGQLYIPKILKDSEQFGDVKLDRSYVISPDGKRHYLPESDDVQAGPKSRTLTIGATDTPQARGIKTFINTTENDRPQFPGSGNRSDLINFGGDLKEYQRSGEKFQNEADKIAGAGYLAKDRLAQLNLLSKVMDNLPATGKGTATLNDLNAVAHNLFGIGTAEEAAWRQVAEKIAANQQVGDIRETNVGQGVAVRQTESEAIKNSQFNLDKQIEANRAVVRMQQRALERELEHSDLANAYIARHGRLDNGFYRARTQYVNEHPFMTDQELARYKDVTKPGQREPGAVLPPPAAPPAPKAATTPRLKYDPATKTWN